MLRLTGVAALVAILASGCGRPEEISVTPVQTMAGTSIPPVDRETPTRLETATFAVG